MAAYKIIDHTYDVVVVGAGGAGLRAAIAVAQAHPELRIALVSKVYPMRSHTVSAEGGAAAVEGDLAIPGVAGTGAPVRLDFLDPGGMNAAVGD